MSKNYVVISHAERMQNPELTNPKIDKSCSSAYDVMSYEDSVENGRVMKKAVVRSFDPVENMSPYRVSDFCMENIIAVGALGSLRACNLSGGTLDVADNVADGVCELMSVMDAAAETNPEK